MPRRHTLLLLKLSSGMGTGKGQSSAQGPKTGNEMTAQEEDGPPSSPPTRRVNSARPGRRARRDGSQTLPFRIRTPKWSGGGRSVRAVCRLPRAPRPPLARSTSASPASPTLPRGPFLLPATRQGAFRSRRDRRRFLLENAPARRRLAAHDATGPTPRRGVGSCIRH